jgi:hypothetical protein
MQTQTTIYKDTDKYWLMRNSSCSAYKLSARTMSSFVKKPDSQVLDLMKNNFNAKSTRSKGTEGPLFFEVKEDAEKALEWFEAQELMYKLLK